MNGKIYISGLIGSYQNEKGVELVDIIQQVKRQPEATRFDVYINSEGGLVDVGFDIYNYLRSLGLPITTIGSGMVASIATVIFMAGSRRVVTPNTQFMIHCPMGGIQDATADDMEVYLKELKATENRIIDFYAKHTNLTKEAIFPLLRNETFLNEKQLFDLGFVTVETPMKIAARAIINNKKPKKMANKKKGKLAELIAKLTGAQIVNRKVLLTADQRELIFPDLEEEDMITLGATATIDGSPAEGEIVDENGRIFVFEAGKLVEIKDNEDEATSELAEGELEEILVEILETVIEVSEEVEEVKEEVTAVKKDRDAYKARAEKAEEILAKLKGKHSPEVQQEPKSKEKKDDVSSVVAQWKANRLKRK